MFSTNWETKIWALTFIPLVDVKECKFFTTMRVNPIIL